jgi:transglutaminase-like putative cysteine protease
VSAPPLLVGAAVVFWGWEAGLLLPALFVALVLESARALTWRLELSTSDFNRIADLCALLFAASAVWVFATSGALRTAGGPRALTLLFQRLPLLFALLVACQAYSTAGRVPLSAFFWALRRRAAREGVAPPAVDLAYPFVVLCVLSASAANVRTPVFYAGLCALAAWALWGERSRRFPPVWWAGLLVVAAVLGWGGQAMLHQAQEKLEQVVFEYIFNIVRRRDTDPFRSSTALGRLGELKLSDRILLRVEPGPGLRTPLLLREASYNVYNSTVWFAAGAAFAPVAAEADGETWRFRAVAGPAPSVGVSAYLPRGRGILALPNGAFEVGKLAAVGVSRNALGAVRVDEGLGLVRYRARFGRDSVLDGPPGGEELSVPAREALLLRQLAAELDLEAKTPAERLAAVAAFFRTRFRYSTYQTDRPRGVSPLEDFLLRSHAGHCEYFATATVLLLRAAGVPARYATGYSVQEWSALERTWVVRARHAHSWTLAWVDDAWRDLDTTPAVWASEEGANSVLEPLNDLWALAEYLFARWRYGEGGSGAAAWLGWLLVPLGLLLAWRLYTRRRRGGAALAAAPAGPRAPRPGEDSEFYLIERELDRAGLGRRPDEPPSAWVRRLREAGAPPPTTAPLPAIVSLHYRYRFDPAGLGADERAALRARVEAWLATHAAAARD